MRRNWLIALGTGLFDRADEVVRSTALQLPGFGALRSIAAVAVVGTVLTVVVMAVTVIIAPVVTVVVVGRSVWGAQSTSSLWRCSASSASVY